MPSRSFSASSRQAALASGFAAACLVLLLVGRAVQADEQGERLAFFEKKIRPVLVEHCYQCHGPEQKSLKGGLRLDHRAGMIEGGDSGPAVAPGNPDESMLLQAMRYDGLEMPPKGKLPARIIRDFEKWIADGVVDPRTATPVEKPLGVDFQKAKSFWAFQRPERPQLPEIRDRAWPRNEIDRFILARLESQGLAPNRPAARRALIRRAYFDLIGLPPSPEEVQSFLEDESPEAFARVVDNLLDSPHYGERWGRRWLDVARYGEDQAHTFKARRYPRGYLYRDWVVQALNDDMPYDRFLKWQIAGDLLAEGERHNRLAALGLFALGPVYYAENVEKAKARADEWDDRIDTLTRGVLGLTVSCARCHDHKFDPITMDDYYGLAGVFASTVYQERPVVSEAVVAQRREADALVGRRQAAIDQLLRAESKRVRVDLVEDIPKYFVASWKLKKQVASGGKEKKVIASLAKDSGLSPTLIKRWAVYLGPKGKRSEDETKRLKGWLDWSESHGDLGDEKGEAEARKRGEEFRDVVAARLARREYLFARHGENAAFAEVSDLADVKPGEIPLGNLFDDSANVSLDAALKTDRFTAAASADRLGVDRVLQGWGEEADIAPNVRFHFGKLGGTSHSFGAIVNDGWQSGAAIRTRGKRFSANKRKEQGVGMHANALITFDLDEIRKAGLLPADQKFRFLVDRAGINDDTFGSGASAYVAVIVSRPVTDDATPDSILEGWVNGRRVDVDVNDFTYYFSGDVADPLRANGEFASFEIDVRSDAKHLTLVTTGAGEPDDNPISSDHTVFSGARLVLDPLPKATSPKDPLAQGGKEGDPQQDRADAVLLSRMLYDEGLLALPAKECESKLAGEAKRRVEQLRDELSEAKKAAEKIDVLKAHSLSDGKSADIRVYIQGNPAKQGEVARRGMPAIFKRGVKDPFDTSGSGRLELAEAVASAENPLTARVMVNRMWAGHFGVGLVKTTSNFGQLGARPTHPDLLDWLAVELIENGWSLKKLHRTIMLSAAYRQSSRSDARGYAADPENRWLWRMNRRRLEVEPWRDSLLAASGELDRTLGGPSEQLDRGGNRRRTLYGFVSRHRLNELLRLFDFPDANITSGERSVTTVPLQQLFVLNSEFMASRAKALAARLGEHTDDDPLRIRRAYELVLARQATPAETDAALAFIGASDQQSDQLDAWEQFCLALLSSNEAMFID